MATDKKSFVAYSDWHGMFKALPDEVAGKLIKHVFSYVNDENPTNDDYIINALFEQIKSTLKRDLKKWEKQREQRSEAGKKSAELRATKFNERSTVVNENVRNSTVSVNVNDNVNVINNNIDSRKLKFADTLKPFIDIYGRDLIKDFYGYWTEPNKSNTKFKQELEKTWDTKRRLENWAKNDINFNKNKNGKSNITDSEQFKELTKSIRSTGDRI
jgi:hypothetical protein